jgi:hypothetical protein
MRDIYTHYILGFARGGPSPNIVPATHAPNGQAVTFNGPPCAGMYLFLPSAPPTFSLIRTN